MDFEQQQQRFDEHREKHGEQLSMLSVCAVLSWECFFVRQFGDNLYDIVQRTTEVIAPEFGWQTPAFICGAMTLAGTVFAAKTAWDKGQKMADNIYAPQATDLKIASIGQPSF